MREHPVVHYDCESPLCRRETAFYQKRRGAQSIEWVDLSKVSDGEIALALAKRNAIKRFHVRDEYGQIHSSERALTALWRWLDGFPLLSRRSLLQLLYGDHSLLVFRKRGLKWQIR